MNGIQEVTGSIPVSSTRNLTDVCGPEQPETVQTSRQATMSVAASVERQLAADVGAPRRSTVDGRNERIFSEWLGTRSARGATKP